MMMRNGTRIASSASAPPSSFRPNLRSCLKDFFMACLSIEHWSHDVRNIVVIRVEADYAHNVRGILDLNITASAAAHLSAHEESRNSADVDGLVSGFISELRHWNDRNQQHPTICNSAVS